MTPVHQKVQILGWEITVSPQNKKVLAVALASLGLFSLQFGLCLATSLAITAVITILTFISSREDTDWFNGDFNQKKIAFLVGFILLRPLIIHAVCSVLGISLPVLAQEGITKLILEKPWQIIPLATVVAPFTEEVLFRGFLMERFEDLGLSQWKSNVAQAIVFGAIHLNQKIKKGWEIVIFSGLSYAGYFFGQIKREENSLLAPMAFHSANNLSSCLYVLSRRV